MEETFAPTFLQPYAEMEGAFDPSLFSITAKNPWVQGLGRKEKAA